MSWNYPEHQKGISTYVTIIQDFVTKWPLVYSLPYQKAIQIVQLLVDEFLPMIMVPEGLLSDRGANMLANLVQDVCQLLGITKLNTIAYNPECDGWDGRTFQLNVEKYI